VAFDDVVSMANRVGFEHNEASAKIGRERVDGERARSSPLQLRCLHGEAAAVASSTCATGVVHLN
jgi:hypothetical protein